MEKQEIVEKDTAGIKYKGWEVRSVHRPILNSKELDEIGISKVPEQLFGNSKLVIRKESSDEKDNTSNFVLELDVIEALKLVGKENSLKVKISEEWTRYSTRNSSEITTVVNPFDWTFTTEYCGGFYNYKGEIEKTSIGIDYEQLKKPEPLLFYDENILFEDDLGDNGISQLSYKVRVMPTGFFILQRFFLRVDGVILRVYDTRMHHKFGTDHLIREVTRRETKYRDALERIKAARDMGKNEDLSILNSSDYVLGFMDPPKFIENRIIYFLK